MLTQKGLKLFEELAEGSSKESPRRLANDLVTFPNQTDSQPARGFDVNRSRTLGRVPSFIRTQFNFSRSMS
jgi:hypothetical protein